jgi:hypothetical protein
MIRAHEGQVKRFNPFLSGNLPISPSQIRRPKAAIRPILRQFLRCFFPLPENVHARIASN